MQGLTKPDNRNRNTIIMPTSKLNEVGRYMCGACGFWQIVQYNPCEGANFNYCPICGAKIILMGDNNEKI